MKKHVYLAALIATLLALTGCSRFDVHKIGIRQGNVVAEDKVEQVEMGMTKSQVRYLLGTPLVHDTFNPDRWDYYWSFTSRQDVTRTRLMTLTFENDVLVKMIDSDADESSEDTSVEAPEAETTEPTEEK